MHHTNIRALALALAAVLCLLLVPAAAADYEPWTYEVDDQMGSYGVDYYGDVGFNDPRAGRSTTGSTGTHSTTTSGGISTYSAEGAGSAAAVDSGLGYTTRQLPGGITLYSPTDGGVSSYALDSGMAVDDGVAEYAVDTKYYQTEKEMVDGINYSVYNVTIPSSIVFDDENTSYDMTVSGTVYNYSELSVSVKANNADATSTNTEINSSLKCGNSEYEIPYTLTLGQTKMGTSASSLTTTLEADQWSEAMQVASSSNNYFVKKLSVKMDEPTNAMVSGKYEDTLTFTFASHKMKYIVTYDPGNGSGTAYTKEYACGASAGVLLSVSDVNFSAPSDSDDYEFLGWSVWKPGASTSGNVYAPGLPIVTLSKVEKEDLDGNDIYENVYTKDQGCLTLYAQWAKKSDAVTTCNATLYYEKNYNRSPLTGVAASGVNVHDYNKNYYTEGSKVTLTNVELQLGQSYYWTLDELETYLDYKKHPERLPLDEAYYDPVSAAKIVVGDTRNEDGSVDAEIYIGRKWICVDVNGEIIKFKDTEHNPSTVSVGNLKIPRYDTEGNRIDTPVGYVTVTYTNYKGETVTTTGTNGVQSTDYWMLHTYGSTVTVTITAAKNYRVTGIRDRTGYSVTNESECNTLTITFNPLKVESSSTESPLSRQISLWMQFEQVNEESAASTAEGIGETGSTESDTTTDTADAGTTGTTTEKDTDTTGDTTKDTDTADDSAADTANDPEQDITPDDLMISDGDEMLARMDAAFAVPYLDDPAY